MDFVKWVWGKINFPWDRRFYSWVPFARFNSFGVRLFLTTTAKIDLGLWVGIGLLRSGKLPFQRLVKEIAQAGGVGVSFLRKTTWFKGKPNGGAAFWVLLFSG